MISFDPCQQKMAGLKKRVPWKFSDAALATIIVVLGFIVATVIIPYPLQGVESTTRNLLTPWVIAITEGLMVMTAWWFTVRKYRTNWSILGLRTPCLQRSFLLTIAVLVISVLLTAVYVSLVTKFEIDLLIPTALPSEVLGTGIPRVMNGLIIVLWGPFTEELFFRGFLLASLISSMGEVRAAIISAAIFAGAHIMISSMIPIFVTGLLLAWLYLRTKSLWPPMMAHALQNLLALGIVL